MSESVTVAIIVAIPPTLASVLAWMHLRKVPKEVNSRLDQLIEASSKVGFSKGLEQGRNEVKSDKPSL